MKSTTTHRFSQVPGAEIARSSFDRSHGHKTTLDAGYLVPIYIDEALPGDTHNVNLQAFGRLSTPIKPTMDNLHLETFFFSIATRLLWDNWTKFNGEQANPGDTTDYLIPQITAPAGGFTQGSLSDYFGLPTLVDNLSVSSLYHRAYNKVIDEWFRDQNLQDQPVISTGDGPDSVADYPLRRRGKRHDYFTSALPFPQKGQAVTLGLGGVAPVVPNSTDARPLIQNTNGEFMGYFESRPNNTNVESSIGALTQNHIEWAQTGMEVDLSSGAAATVNALREAFQVQRMLERDARSGTRYPEVIKAHFGVTHPDQGYRSEYLGGGSSPMNITPVANTVNSFGQFAGQLGAMGTVVAQRHGFTKSFTEHSIIIGLVNVRADLTYQQGINRRFLRQTRYDHFWPALQHLGEQEIWNKEIFAQGTGDDEEIFGYQERYAEYRYSPSMVTGKFRSNDPQSLDVWHLAQDFANLPTLSDSFIQDTPPVDRISAVPSEPDLILDMYFRVNSARPMPTYSVPGMIDHF